MAIAFDAFSSHAPTQYENPATHAHTCTGANLYLMVAVVQAYNFSAATCAVVFGLSATRAVPRYLPSQSTLNASSSDASARRE